MISPKGNDRSWKKPLWKYIQRLDRCMQRAVVENTEKQLMDIMAFGSSIVTPDDQNKITERCNELMRGLKPKSPEEK